MPIEESSMDNHPNKRYLLAIDNGTPVSYTHLTLPTKA